MQAFFGHSRQMHGPSVRGYKLLGTQKWRKWKKPTGKHQMVQTYLENIKVCSKYF